MFEDYERKKRKQVSGMRSLKDYGMGVFILLMGLFFLLREQVGGTAINERLGKPDTLEYLFGSFSVLYGSWRIYRGYKKNYF
ncbi:MAG: hypothetical protein HZA79_11575 [Sphingobacteriales bacterium]|nr:hypothetical protein [Sphingobacteriales bacterium]